MNPSECNTKESSLLKILNRLGFLEKQALGKLDIIVKSISTIAIIVFCTYLFNQFFFPPAEPLDMPLIIPLLIIYTAGLFSGFIKEKIAAIITMIILVPIDLILLILLISDFSFGFLLFAFLFNLPGLSYFVLTHLQKLSKHYR